MVAGHRNNLTMVANAKRSVATDKEHQELLRRVRVSTEYARRLLLDLNRKVPAKQLKLRKAAG
jgi:hypothetical protein